MRAEARCRALWVRSDGLAMERDAAGQLLNHRELEALLLTMAPQYLPWMVCDATQKLTLAAGGHGAYWRGLYRYACAHTPVTAENVRVCFEMHRAAVDVPAKEAYPADGETSRLALAHLRALLPLLREEPGYAAYELAVWTQELGHRVLFGEETGGAVERGLASLEAVLTLLAGGGGAVGPAEEAAPPGSWEALNRVREPFVWGGTAAGNFAVQLVHAARDTEALACAARLAALGVRQGAYYARMLALAEERHGVART